MADQKAEVPLAPRLTSAESEALAARAGLDEMGVRPPLGRYIKQVWERRSFIWNLSASRAYSRNQGSYLGQAWAILRPVLDAAVYVIIFGFLFHSSAPGIENRAAFITIGTFTYSLFQTSVMSGLNSVPTNLQLIRSHKFPRAVVPLATVMTETVLFAPILVAMMAVVLVTGVLPGMGVVVPTWSWLTLPFAAVLLAVFSAGVAMFFARLGARAPDIANAMPFILTLGRYASGAMFLISAMVPDELWLKPLLLHQPVAIYLELFRAAFGNEPLIPMTTGLWLEATAWAVGVFAIGFLYFWRAEETYGRD
ncbi:ABC transporter permease [Brachybacterium paraconglomeratum]|uniref:ABC transporter permease n=1 Tax=Brachybacterium paraconglomeratum TaxID=173362 RepID=UPI0021A8C086|nr:ABC transporter permease [Brachybacterium paraconglomeratum]MCT1909268.1 ABC transporter permease [Brachybacterium paraconglomeratum]